MPTLVHLFSILIAYMTSVVISMPLEADYYDIFTPDQYAFNVSCLGCYTP